MCDVHYVECGNGYGIEVMFYRSKPVYLLSGQSLNKLGIYICFRNLKNKVFQVKQINFIIFRKLYFI